MVVGARQSQPLSEVLLGLGVAATFKPIRALDSADFDIPQPGTVCNGWTSISNGILVIMLNELYSEQPTSRDVAAKVLTTAKVWCDAGAFVLFISRPTALRECRHRVRKMLRDGWFSATTASCSFMANACVAMHLLSNFSSVRELASTCNHVHLVGECGSTERQVRAAKQSMASSSSHRRDLTEAAETHTLPH